MVVFDCCPFTYAPLVKSLSSRTQDVVLVFEVVLTTSRHVPPLSSSRPDARHSMYRIVYACVAWLYHLIMTSGHAGMSSVSCSRDIMLAVHVA